MWQYAIKVLLSAVVIVAVAEPAKSSTFWGAALASLPLTSLLAFIWLYLDTGDAGRVAGLSQGVFWLVLPSLVLAIALPLLLRAGWNFWFALAISCVVTAAAYVGMAGLLDRLGMRV
jgi:hypothetical protein